MQSNETRCAFAQSTKINHLTIITWKAENYFFFRNKLRFALSVLCRVLPSNNFTFWLSAVSGESTWSLATPWLTVRSVKWNFFLITWAEQSKKIISMKTLIIINKIRTIYCRTKIAKTEKSDFKVQKFIRKSRTTRTGLSPSEWRILLKNTLFSKSG